MTALDVLLTDLFEGQHPTLYAEVEGWLKGSRRFRAFVTSYQTKIRAKLRTVRDENGVNDVQAELETAALLLREKRFAIAYETYVATKERGPDFTVTFKTHTPFNVEVRRIRNSELDEAETEVPLGKLMAVLWDKVGQMPASIINLLWLIAERPISEAALTQAVTTLCQLAGHKAEDFFTRCGFESAADFLKYYRRLSGIVVRQRGETRVWLNKTARHKAPPEIVTAIQRLDAV
ncbi:MAG TPA: hypothetical protein PLD47_09205 [Aggregatilineales bacterium]|nr:hypothetical protein [Anaerolineales bacterium]HRE47892.1 hypothetical protein [Aggregatilineales bacterium]